MNVVMLCAPSLGGSSVVAVELARALVARDHRVTLISTDRPMRLRGQQLPPGLDVVTARAPSHPVYRAPPDTAALASAVAHHARAADVIHAHYALPYGLAGLLGAEMSGRPLVLSVHGTDVVGLGGEPSVAPAVDHLLARAAVVTAVSPWLRDAVLGRLSAARDIRVVPNFIAARSHRVPGDDPATPRAPGLVHVSNFRPVKRPRDAVRVLAALRCDGLDVALTCFGDGPLAGPAADLADELGVGDGLHIRGLVPAGPTFSPGQVLLAPSEEEAFGLAALEALAAGIPVVGSRVGGLAGLIEDGPLPPAGALHPVGDVPAMAAAAGRLLRDPAAYDRASAAARERAKAYGEEPAVAGYLDAYRRAMGGPVRDDARAVAGVAR